MEKENTIKDKPVEVLKPEAVPVINATPPSPKKSKKKWLILVIILVVLFMLFGRGVLFLIIGADVVDPEIKVPEDISPPVVNTNQNTNTAVKTNSNKNSKPVATPVPVVDSRKEAIEYLIAVGMKGDNGRGPDTPLTKYIKPTVTFKVLGTPTGDSNQCVDRILGDMNALVDPVNFVRDDSATDFDVTVRFLPQDQLNELYSRRGGTAPANLFGYMTYGMNHQGSEEMLYGSAYVANNSPISDIVRCAVTRHEMTHTIGLPYNSTLHTYSIFGYSYEGRSDYIEIDKEVIRLLYNSGISTGLNEEQVRSFFGI